MMAKNAQIHSGVHRSGYLRIFYGFFSMQPSQYGKYSYSILCTLCNHRLSVFAAMNHPTFKNVELNTNDGMFIQPSKYAKNRFQLSIIKPASLSGVDVRHRCMPNHFGHIPFGRLKRLSNDVHYCYQDDRIYIKPEAYGLQQ